MIFKVTFVLLLVSYFHSITLTPLKKSLKKRVFFFFLAYLFKTKISECITCKKKKKKKEIHSLDTLTCGGLHNITFHPRSHLHNSMTKTLVTTLGGCFHFTFSFILHRNPRVCTVCCLHVKRCINMRVLLRK